MNTCFLNPGFTLLISSQTERKTKLIKNIIKNLDSFLFLQTNPRYLFKQVFLPCISGLHRTEIEKGNQSNNKVPLRRLFSYANIKSILGKCWFIKYCYNLIALLRPKMLTRIILRERGLPTERTLEPETLLVCKEWRLFV